MLAPLLNETASRRSFVVELGASPEVVVVAAFLLERRLGGGGVAESETGVAAPDVPHAAERGGIDG
jgi:hypothetical protein